MDFLTLAKERYSCRKFSGKEVGEAGKNYGGRDCRAYGSQ